MNKIKSLIRVFLTEILSPYTFIYCPRYHTLTPLYLQLTTLRTHTACCPDSNRLPDYWITHWIPMNIIQFWECSNTHSLLFLWASSSFSPSLTTPQIGLACYKKHSPFWYCGFEGILGLCTPREQAFCPVKKPAPLITYNYSSVILREHPL